MRGTIRGVDTWTIPHETRHEEWGEGRHRFRFADVVDFFFSGKVHFGAIYFPKKLLFSVQAAFGSLLRTAPHLAKKISNPLYQYGTYPWYQTVTCFLHGSTHR